MNSKTDIRTEIGRINDLLKEFEVRSQIFQVSVDEKYAQVNGKQGTIISINPSDLIAENGLQLGKTIEIELKELTNQEQLFRASAQTTSNGQLLVSGGAYYINMTSNGQQLKLKEGKSLLVEFPKISSSKMTLFYGKRDSIGLFDWKETNQRLEIQTRPGFASIPIPLNQDTNQIFQRDEKLRFLLKELEFGRTYKLEDSASSIYLSRINEEIKDRKAYLMRKFNIQRPLTKLEKKINEEQKKNEAVNKELYRAIEVKQLGWINCDRFYSVPNKTNLQYVISSKDSVVSAIVFLVFKDINSVMQSSYISFEDKIYNSGFQNIPVGEQTKLIAFSTKNSKIYTYKSDLTIKVNETVQLTLKETNKNEIGSRPLLTL